MEDRPAVLFKPRTAVKFSSNGGFSHRPTRGKNYRMPGALMTTYRQREKRADGHQQWQGGDEQF